MPEALLTIPDILHGQYLKNFAQFNNPVNLAFDAAIVLTLGVSILFAKRIIFKIGGCALILLGLFMIFMALLGIYMNGLD